MEEGNTLDNILETLKELVTKTDKLGLKLYHIENKIDKINQRVQ